uniref:(northern house mosquito) hypothetical protein n=1 Tax=Culex pipiens TaxID=7175 RepID=A0A8D8BI53_CULPI
MTPPPVTAPAPAPPILTLPGVTAAAALATAWPSSANIVGKCCCERKGRGAGCADCGNKKDCFCRGEMGINLGPCWCTESEFILSGAGSVFWRANSGDRLMLCGESCCCFLGGDVGSSFTC